jgi:hypothetical protein
MPQLRSNIMLQLRLSPAAITVVNKQVSGAQKPRLDLLVAYLSLVVTYVSLAVTSLG